MKTHNRNCHPGISRSGISGTQPWDGERDDWVPALRSAPAGMTRLGRVSLLALVCALGAGASAGQEGKEIPCPPDEIEKSAIAFCNQRSREDNTRVIDVRLPIRIRSTKLDPVIIEGRQIRTGQTAASVSVIGGDEIERLNALRLGDVLANVPGVFFSGLNLSLIHI